MPTTPADLARELDIPQKRVREFLRSEFGTLPTGTPRWELSDDRADKVRSHFANEHASRPLEGSSTQDLLTSYAEILLELRTRQVIRTSNAPLGDYAEHLALRVYGGSLAANSARSYDITAMDGRRVQVKARTLGAGTSRSAVFSVFRSFDFEVACFLVFSATTYELLWAREMLPAQVQEAARWSAHVNGYLLRMSIAERLGVDVTAAFDEVLAADLAY